MLGYMLGQPVSQPARAAAARAREWVQYMDRAYLLIMSLHDLKLKVVRGAGVPTPSCRSAPNLLIVTVSVLFQPESLEKDSCSDTDPMFYALTHNHN